MDNDQRPVTGFSFGARKLRHLFFVCLVLVTWRDARAFEHHMIPWFFGVSEEVASPTIAVGDTVTWTWSDALIHSVRNPDGAFNSGLVGPSVGFTYTFVFDTPGDYYYLCDAHGASMDGTITVVASGVKFVGRVVLEGAYSESGDMSTTLGGDIPLSQPYDDAVFDGTPLDYDGAESVISFPSGTVDWLLVDLRTGSSAATAVESALQPAFLINDGLIVGLDGDTLTFDGVDQVPYHVVIRHRNHLSVMTPDPIPEFSDGVGVWDFTTGIGQAYSDGGNPQKLVDVSGIYGMFASDGNADGQTTAPDFNLWNAATTAGATGYLQADFNMDGQVTAPDFNLWNANTTAGAASQVPE